MFHFDQGNNGQVCHILCVKAKKTKKRSSNASKQNFENSDFMVLKIGCVGSAGEQDVRFKESCDYFFIHNYHTTFYEQGCVYNF
jgi:hypothetical protein